MKKQKHRAGKLRKVFTVSGMTASNSVDPAFPVSGLVGKGKPVPNYEIPEGIFKRELEEYLRGKQTV